MGKLIAIILPFYTVMLMPPVVSVMLGMAAGSALALGLAKDLKQRTRTDA